MKSLGFIITIIAFSNLCFAQEGENPLPWNMPEPVYDTAPQYPGGPTAMRQFFADSVRYPEPEKSKGLQGGVYLKFIVDTSGAVTNVQLINGVPYAPNLAKEALRLMYSMPRWIPATKNGKPVEAEYF
ncbi:hypothetical protein LBMAG27_03060 [Bacteroidota bacterium]|nr:hypothetical protein LBMAG27_03060 [Bacteroidota bacterium]